MDKAIRDKAKLLGEYFVKLCMYLDNGVAVNYELRKDVHILKRDEFLFVKTRYRMNNDAMVYLLDKHIPHEVIKLNVAPVTWYATGFYDKKKFITVDISYDNEGHLTYVKLELTDQDSMTTDYLYAGENIVLHLDDEDKFTYMDFFTTFEEKVKLYKNMKNFVILDEFEKYYSEKIGAPEVHIPLDLDDMDLV